MHCFHKFMIFALYFVVSVVCKIYFPKAAPSRETSSEFSPKVQKGWCPILCMTGYLMQLVRKAMLNFLMAFVIWSCGSRKIEALANM